MTLLCEDRPISPAAKRILSLFEGGTKLTRAQVMHILADEPFASFEKRDAFLLLTNSKRIVRADRDARPYAYVAVEYRTTKRGLRSPKDIVPTALHTQPNSVFTLAKKLEFQRPFELSE